MSLRRSVLAILLTLGGLSPGQPAPTADPALPKILLIGDSISGGYEKGVKKRLEGKAVVVKNEGNAEWTGNGVKKIDAWLGDTRWDVIHFNWGLWDMYGWKYFTEDRSPEAYAARLERLVTRMEATGAKLIWATTTPACTAAEKTMKKQFRQDVVITPEIQAKYQEAALQVMKRHNVQVNDLYNHMLPGLPTYSLGPDDVHFNDAGSHHLAKQVANVLEEAIRKP